MNHATSTANHSPFAAVYANSTARLAATGFARQAGGGIVPFDSDDVGKLALQLSDFTAWILSDDSPVTWLAIALGGGSGTIGGTLGATDNRVPRSDGTGGSTLQASSVTITDDGNVGIGTNQPIFNDDGTTGANVGRWLAVDGNASGFAGYFGVGGTIPGTSDRVGVVNFYNLSMGGADNRTAAIFSFNDGALGKGNMQFYTAPSSVGPVKRMEINWNGDIGINHDAGIGSRLQIMGETSDNTTTALVLLKVGDVPYFFARNDGKVFIATTNPASAVAPASDGVFLVGQAGEFSVKSNGDVLQRSIQFVGGTRPTANSTNRGMIWYVPGGAGVEDTIEVCEKDAADVYSWVSIAPGAWQSWVPTWTNLTLGNGTAVAKFTKIGKTIHCRVSLVLGSTSAVSGDIRLSLPVTRSAYAGTAGVCPFGVARAYDASVGTDIFIADVVSPSTTTVAIRFHLSSTHTKEVGASSTVPFTWTTSDELAADFSYEAA